MNGNTSARVPDAAVEAVRRGYTPVAIRDGGKSPRSGGWQNTRWDADDLDAVRTAFEESAAKGSSGVGLLLGTPGGRLVDIDLDHHQATRLKDHLLPPTPMESGRAGHARSHRWYVIDEDSEVPALRQYKMPDGSMGVELRSTGGQTVIPPSVHPSGEEYLWEGEPWGGEAGPAVVDGQRLSIQVAMLHLGAILVENWPRQGGRHEAYLNLAGGLLRYGDDVHPYWERNLPVLISAIADVTHDDDGPEKRVSEVVGSTVKKIRAGVPVSGFPKLAEVIGQEHVDAARRQIKEVESLSGFVPEVVRDLGADLTDVSTGADPYGAEHGNGAEEGTEGLDGAREAGEYADGERNPLEERVSTWAAVDLQPYLSGQVTMPEPSVLRREDGACLIYPGRVNMIYGKSESGKSWVSLHACREQMSLGERVMYIDLEDEPAGTMARMKAIGASDEDILSLFRYVHPEGPLAAMQRSRFGKSETEDGQRALEVFKALLARFDPTLVVIDGMTVLYGLHGQDTNDAMGTDVITGWLKSVTRGGRTTVIVIDHTGKGGGPGASPIGAHHKIAMIQGVALRADAVVRPMPGGRGHLNLVVYKDRPGAVRAVSTPDSEQVAAEVHIDSTDLGVTRMRVVPPTPGLVTLGSTDAHEQKLASLAQAEELREAVMAIFGGDLDKKVTTAQVCEELNLRPAVVYDMWKMLETSGVVRRMGTTRWTYFRLVAE